MYTSILLVALTGIAPSAEGNKALAWSLDYTAASKLAAQEKKPLAVFLAPGKDAYQKLSSDGQLGAEAEGLLSSQYVCVHVDTSSARGKELAQAFNVPMGLGIVISDQTGEKQAFRHEGDLARTDLVRYLKRYSDPTFVFVETESNPGHRAHAASATCSGSYCSTCSGGSCSGGRRSHGRRSGGGCSVGSCSGGRRHR